MVINNPNFNNSFGQAANRMNTAVGQGVQRAGGPTMPTVAGVAAAPTIAELQTRIAELERQVANLTSAIKVENGIVRITANYTFVSSGQISLQANTIALSAGGVIDAYGSNIRATSVRAHSIGTNSFSDHIGTI